MQQRTDRDYGWPLLLVFFALVAAAFVARAILNADSVPLFADTDDAMRLVTVRDLLNGQNWFDTVQHRLNAPYGAQIHWSRLVDAPIAGLMLVLQPFAGAATTTVVGFVWPLFLLLLLLVLTSLVSHELVGRQGRLAAVALPALSLVTMVEFVPGRIDHHSVQILLCLALLWCILRSLSRPGFAVGAGLLAATSIAIGIEGIPTLAAGIAAIGLVWVFRPERADVLRNFGLAFGLGALVQLAIALPPERWFIPACDAISVVYVAAAVGCGLVYVVLSLLPLGRAHPLLRFALLALGGGLVVLGLGLAYPDCLRGPYSAVDPWLTANWLNQISEAGPAWDRLFVLPAYVLAVCLPPLLGLIVVGWRVLRGPKQGRGAWLIYGLFLLFAVLVMLLQIRACRFAGILAVPAGAWAIVGLRQHYLRKVTVLSVAGLLAGWLAFSGLAIAVTTTAVASVFPSPGQGEAALSKAACLQPGAFADLAGMPPERIMAPIDLGSHLLAFTPHSVVAAPYHRNQQGVRDAFAFFNDPISQARLILDIRGISLVVICPQLAEMRGLPGAAPDSFVKLFAAGKLPDWLEDRSLPGATLKVYAVRR